MNEKLKILLCLVAIAIIFQTGCVKPVKVEGMAMSPTLNNGDRIFLSVGSENLKRGDIIAFLYPKNKEKWFIKRIIGLPGENVEIKNGTVFINGQKIEETYLNSDYNQSMANLFPVLIQADNYFVLGDNRDNSADSRIWGTVPKSLIIGKYLYKYAESE